MRNLDNQAVARRRVIPPDPNGDVGPNHYFQITNVVFDIYDKQTGSSVIGGPAPNSSLWTMFGGPCENRNDGDPIVLYDDLAGRWFVSQFALPNGFDGPFFQCIAVSASGDPTAEYFRYQYRWSENKLNDYPKFGVWPDGYYMSVNQFERMGSNFVFVGVGVAAFERHRMLRGRPARMIKFDLEGRTRLYGMLPGDLDGPPLAGRPPNPFIQVDDDVVVGVPRDRLRIVDFHANWRRPRRSFFGNTSFVRVPSFDSMCLGTFNCIPQPGTATKLDAISGQVMHRAQHRNLGTHRSLVVNHTVDVDPSPRSGDIRAAVRWYELRDTGGGWSLAQQGTYAGDDPDTDDEHRWMGSVAMDGNGNIAFGYSVSNETTTVPAIRYTGRLVSDPEGDVGGEVRMHEGLAPQESPNENRRHRWGDYTMMAVDPSGCGFWYTNEYSTGGDEWATHIGGFGFPATPDVAPPASVVMRAPGPNYQRNRMVPARWNATDCQSGVGRHVVLKTTAPVGGPFDGWRRWRVTGEDETTERFRSRLGDTHCFRVRAKDKRDNWASFSARECTAVPLDNTQFRHRGGWRARRGGGYYLGSVSVNHRRGAAMGRPGVRARNLAILATTCGRCGVIDVVHGGEHLRRVDLSRWKRERARLIHVDRDGRFRRGRVVIRVVSQGKPVKIEGLGVSRV